MFKKKREDYGTSLVSLIFTEVPAYQRTDSVRIFTINTVNNKHPNV